MVTFQPEDKVLVNSKHGVIKTLKDIGGGNWKYDLATDALRCKVPDDFKIFRIAHTLASACEYPRVSTSTVAPVDVAHTYGYRHTWRYVFHRIPSVFIRVYLRLIFVSLSDRTRKIKFELFRKLSIIFLFEIHREHRVHREKWQHSAFSVYSVVDYLCEYSFFQKKLKSLLFHIQDNIESAKNDQIHSCLNLSKNKPQRSNYS